jgi:gluconate 2-dehydrogenase gamma chain
LATPASFAPGFPGAPAQNGATHSAGGGGHGAFLNDDDLAALVANYIDLALAGAYADQGDFYRRGLQALDAYCVATHKDSFVYLKPAQQDEVVGALESGKATGFAWPTAQAFFNALRTHTMEGMFSDPIYGGNKDFAGWKLVGFPGAQPTFTKEDMQSSKPFTRAPIVGLQSRVKAPNGTKRG